ncbi:hypothetical protein GQE99_14460 [Maritimibacter sp. DP07]|uniref:Phage tail tape measure protein n=1 Tax=Maritimibacter harenae TaxID=2606218 RepID=A0A845M4S7_9RHOB|nr:hypothetical protein [Maritimibacter harenae]MZR14222.1 hypothetical protein [Maritimibacter harenae]
MAAVIGALRAVMSLDSAAFERGLSKAQKRVADFQKKIDRMGQRMQRAGALMTAGITAPIAGLSALAVKSTDSLIELENLARVAGVTTQKFKVLELTAGQFGIEQDKLADILKDVNDKFGDYFQTGAGPLADFFENIAPKIGITADAFKGLSSDEALGLYIRSLEKAGVSQQEMTFYMEALASDATLLLPMFQKNGAAIEEMAKKAEELGLVLDGDTIRAARKSREEFALVAEILKTKLQASLAQLLPAFTQLASAALPALTKLSEGIANLAEWFTGLNPKTQRFVAIGTALAAALGPVVLGLGLVVSAMAPLLAILGAILSPIGLVVAAVAALAGGAYLIYQNWETVGPWFAEKWEQIKTITAEKWEQIKVVIAEKMGQWRETLAMKWQEIKASFAQWTQDMLQLGHDLVQRVIDGLQQKWAEAREAVTQLGRNIAEGIRSGVQSGWEAVKNAGSSLVDAVRGGFSAKAEIQSPSRLFMRLADYIVDGVVNGLDQGAGKLRAASTRMSDAIAIDPNKAVNGLDQVSGAVEKTAGKVNSLAQQIGSTLASTFSSWIKDAIKGTFNLRDALADLAGQIGGMLIDKAISGLMGGIFPGFATGTSYAPGGMAVVGERGPELVNLPRGSQVVPNHEVGETLGGMAPKIVNVLDPGVVGDYLATEPGERLIINTIRRNRDLLNA